MIHLDLQVAVEDPKSIFLPGQEDCLHWVESSLLEDWAGGETELVVRIVDEAESRQINSEYRGKDKPANVLSFPFENPPGLLDLGEELPYLGDLVICASIVNQEARDQQKTEQAHWAHMVVHGCLHLQGFDHLDEQQAEEMESLEIEILEGLGFDSPYGDT